MTGKERPEDHDLQKAAESALADFHREQDHRLEAQQVLAESKRRRKIVGTILRWGLVVLCLGITGYEIFQYAELRRQSQKPLRKGPTNTTVETDQCVDTLWKVSKRLQEGRPLGADLRCPASRLPLEIVKTVDDLIVRIPKPELYGVKEIRVSKMHPVPEVVP